MANVLVEENSLSSIANAIRTKNGLLTTYKPAQMPQAILDISTGIDTSDATAYATDLMSGKTAYARGSKITGTYTWDTDSNYDTCDDIADDILNLDSPSPTPPSVEPAYTRVEYLQNTGTQLIDLGVAWSLNYRLEMEMQDVNTNQYNLYMGDNSTNLQIQKDNNTRIYLMVAHGGGGYVNFNFSAYRNYIVVDGNTTYINGSAVQSASTGGFTPTETTMKLFGMSESFLHTVSFRVYSLRIIDKTTGKLVIDLIPVKDGDGVPCFYDRVAKDFLYDVMSSATPFTTGNELE